MISILRRARQAVHSRQLGRPAKPVSVSPSFAWPAGAAGAVSLTYDDGLECHLQHVAPRLEAAGLRGTFYAHVMSDGLRSHTAEWRQAVARGHELGNHTVFHPCRNNPGISPEFDLRHYGEKRWCLEMELANWILQQVDGETVRTFGNTCWDNWIGPDEKPICLEQLIPRFFLAARGERSDAAVNPRSSNPYNLGTMSADGMECDALQTRIEKAMAAGEWLILSLHGVGEGSHSLFIAEKDHQSLLDWLARNQSRIWTAPLKTVAMHLAQSAGFKASLSS